MSKGGGAGKVYFVLYLAVVLELLIIIVERDEAEEHLHKKQQETMKIVESILTQLQSGAGTEGINTRPQDEITITPPGINMREMIGSDIKSYRRYSVEVGVTDVSTSLKRREGETDKEHVERLQKLVELANVAELQYQIFYSSSQDPTSAPMFQTDEYIKKNNIDFLKMQPGQKIPGPNGEDWELLAVRQLNLDSRATFDRLVFANLKSTADISPVYPKSSEVVIGPSYAPPNLSQDSVFFYSETETRKLATASGLNKRSFIVNFQPPSRAGWYKLRFSSRTNRILGVRSDQSAADISDDATVNIGTVQLTVRDLRKVLKELQNNLEKFSLPDADEFIKTRDIDKFNEKIQAAIEVAMSDREATELIGKIRLFSYIAQLLAPGMSSNFDQNRGSIEFNVRVITPKPNIAEPTINMASAMYCFDAVNHVFDISISPYQPGQNTVTGNVLDKSGNVVSRISFKALDEIPGSGVSTPRQGEKRDYRGTVEAKLSPGEYKIEVVHNLQSRRATQSATLGIFRTGLTDESERKIVNTIDAYAYYGGSLLLDVIPESGNKIAANQFRIYAYFDKDMQKPPVEGLAITRNMNFVYTPDKDNISIRVTWVQPASGVEVELFPTRTFEIKQEPASINTRDMRVEVSGQPQRIKISIKGIRISKPTTGVEGTLATVRAEAKTISEKTGTLNAYELAAGPEIEDAGDGTYNINLEMSGNLPRGETKIKGTLTIPVNVVAINPINNKQSRSSAQRVTVSIDYSPERGGPRRR